MPKPATLDAAIERQRDNYLPLRHLAAILVIYGHSYALSRHAPSESDLIQRLMPGFYAGSFAVYLFFAISGYLVTLSLLRNPGLLRYARNRFLRVYPAYLVCLLACAFGFGAAFTTLPLGDYLLAPGTWHYLSRNLDLIALAWNLPGVFEGNAIPGTVNGTLWSLGLEVRWYVYLGLLAALTLVRRRWAFTAIALALLSYGAWEWQSGKPDPVGYRALSQTYLVAALCAQWRKHIPVSHAVMATLVLVAGLAHGSRWFAPIAVVGTVYLTFWIAYALPALRRCSDRDYSYGLFLYGFPVQQSLVALFPNISPLELFTIALPWSFFLATLSWHLVEHPPLHWKLRQEPALVPAM